MSNLIETVKKVTEHTGYFFKGEEVEEIFEYSKRKCSMNGKPDDYVNLIIEDELYNYAISNVLLDFFIKTTSFEEEEDVSCIA